MRIKMASKEDNKYTPRRLATVTIRVQSDKPYERTVERCLRVFIRSGIFDNGASLPTRANRSRFQGDSKLLIWPDSNTRKFCTNFPEN